MTKVNYMDQKKTGTHAKFTYILLFCSEFYIESKFHEFKKKFILNNAISNIYNSLFKTQILTEI